MLTRSIRWGPSRNAAKCLFSSRSSTNPADNIMSNVVQGPSLLLTTLHRPEPSLMIMPGLRSLPFWTNNNGQVAYQDPQVSKIVQHLQKHVAEIRDEYVKVSPTIPSDYKVGGAGTEHHDDDDDSLHTGNWDWHSYLLHGQVQPKFCEHFPVTTSAIQEIGSDLFTKTPFGFCFFSKLAGDSTISAHASPINFRLRIHLPLIVPPPSTGEDNIGIRVGPISQKWISDQALCLDDSYNHDVWNKTKEERVVLIVDIWHPDVRQSEREEIVRMFQHAKQKGWLKKDSK